MNSNSTLVADRASHRCEYCHAPELVFNFPFEIEHITPLSKQGAYECLRSPTSLIRRGYRCYS